MAAGTARHGCRGARVLLAVALVLVGCTSAADRPPAPIPSPAVELPDPAPEPVVGLRVGVVLPPSEAVADRALERMVDDLDRLRARLPDEVAELRTVVPDATAYVSDAVAVLADDGYGLVCVVGPTAATAVSALAPQFPRTRFCVLPARLGEGPSNVLGIDVRVEEFAFLAGAAAARPSGDGPVFIVGPARFATERQRVAFLAGVERVRGTIPEPTTTIVVADADEAYAAATAAYDGGTFVTLTDAGSADRAVLQAAQEQGSLVIGTEATLRDAEGEDGTTPPISPSVLLLLRERLDVPVRLAIEQALGDWSGGALSVGFAEGALELVDGGSAIWPVIEPQIAALRDALVAGDVVVPAPR